MRMKFEDTTRSSGRLLRDLLLLLLLVVVLMSGVLAYYGFGTRQELTETLVSRAATSAAREFSQLMVPVDRLLQVVGDWGEQGLLANRTPEQLIVRLVPLLKSVDKIIGMQLVYADGREIAFRRQDDTWLLRVTEPGGRQLRQNWDGKKLSPAEVVESDYDPRQRPWYELALGSAGVNWTHPYRFYSDQQLGLTAVTSWEHESGPSISGVDLTIEALAEALRQLDVLPGGIVFLLGSDSAALLPPSLLEQDQGLTRQLQGLAQEWEKAGAVADQPLSLSVDGDVWWGGFHQAVISGQSIWVGLAAPEEIFSDHLSDRRLMTLALVLVVLLCAGLLALLLARRHQKTTLLPGSPLTEEHIRQLIAQGESTRLEFKSTMRMNLKRGKAGKEIEIAWLKGVIGMMNTDGGVLLLGVDDAGAILGLNADNFANEDRCLLHFKNLISRHVGLEHSRFLYFELVDIDQMQVGVIRIEKSPQPAFLKQGQDEEFYIRSGPASVKLTGSKMLKYLRSHKA